MARSMMIPWSLLRMHGRSNVAICFCFLISMLCAGQVAAQGGGGGQGGQGGNSSGAAGIVVDADGVLHTRLDRDPGGQLQRQRLAQARATLNRDLARPSKMRKVSLNRLEAELAAQFATGGGVTDEMHYLAGMTRIDYVFFYPESGDIVIAGPAGGFFENPVGRMVGFTSGRPVLRLEDLVVALRAFPPGRAPTQIIGVSIDPTPEGLKRMRETWVQIGRRQLGPRPNSAQTQSIVAALGDSLGRQTVTIKGVSAKSHFAQVLVEADYRMKLIGIGLERPPVNIPSWVSRAKSSSIARNALQRWYFIPDYESVRVSEDDLAFELVGESVRLVSSDEMVTADGGRIASGQVDRASQVFTTTFTKKYPELASRSPVFAELRNLIDLSLVAAFIQRQDYYGQAHWTMELFSSEQEFPVENYTAPRQVETAVNAIWKGGRLLTPIGGGVLIQPLKALADGNQLTDDNGELKARRTTVSLDGLEDGQWWWD